MKNKLLLAVISAMLLLTSCAQSNTSSTVSTSSDSTDSVESSVVNSEPIPESEVSDSHNEVEMGSESESCDEHVFSYHYITTDLLNYVGQDIFDKWADEFSNDEYGRIQEGLNIQSFIEHFDIPREVFEEIINTCADNLIEADPTEDRDEYLEDYGYTDAQIDALYSGDQAKINEAFCGEMACYNPKDGKLYSIYWLSDHTGDEYKQALLSQEDVHRIIDTATEAGGVYAELAEKAAPAVDRFDSTFETCRSYIPCTEHTFSYHSVNGVLLEQVDNDTLIEWDHSFTDDEYGRGQEGMTIQKYIEDFNISREVFEKCVNEYMDVIGHPDSDEERNAFLEEYGYTDSQIDALYSGDQAKINEAFCGEMAYYNPEDGQLYSIYWLSDHTAEDYENAGVPEAEVKRILGLAEEAGGGYARFAEEAKEAASEYAAMN